MAQDLPPMPPVEAHAAQEPRDPMAILEAEMRQAARFERALLLSLMCAQSHICGVAMAIEQLQPGDWTHLARYRDDLVLTARDLLSKLEASRQS